MPDSDNPFAKYGPRIVGDNPFAKYGPRTDPQVGGASALLQGLAHGAGNILYGGAQLGARMGAATDTGFGPESDPSRIAQIDRATSEREAAYRASPGVRRHPVLSGVGDIGGEVLATAPLMAVGGVVSPATTVGRAALAAGLGAAGGALEPARDARQRAANALVGGTLGAGLSGVGSAVGGAIAPRLASDAAALAKRGVVLSPGEMVQRGGLMRDIEERATSLPVLGRFIADTRSRSIDGFNRATINQALEPIGQTLSPTEVGHTAIRQMGDRIGRAYDRVFSQVPRVDVDVPLIQDMATIEGAIRGRPYIADMVRGEWNHAFRNAPRLGGAIGPRGGALRIPPMTGENAKQAISNLATKARELARSNDPWQREVGELLTDGRNAVLDAIDRQYPAVAGDLHAANTAWAMAVRVENAAGRRAGGEGRFTPMDLLSAVRADARGVRRREFARGDAILQQWGETGQRVLPSTLGESGTTPRAHLLNPFAWGAGIAGRPLYGALAAPARSQQSAAQRAVGETARRLPLAVAPLIGEYGAAGDAIAGTYP